MAFGENLESSIPQHYKKFYVSYGKVKEKIYRIVKFAQSNKTKLQEKLKFLQKLGDLNIDENGKNEKTFEKNVSINTSAVMGGSITQQMSLWEFFPEAKFRDLMQIEIKKINYFANFKYHQIYQNLILNAKNIQEISKEKNKKIDVKNVEEILKKIENELDILAAEIVHLESYIRNHYKILMRLGEIFDDWMNMSINQWFSATLIKEKFCNLDVDKLLIILSLTWEKHRNAYEEKLKNTNLSSTSVSETWHPPESFVRNTTKYWLKLDKVVRAKVAICKYLPYLIFGVSQKDLDTLLNAYLLAENPFGNLNKNIQESQPIASVYFDNKDGYCYENRILRYENAQLLRIRWYGDNNGEKSKEVFVERKTHHEGWSGEASTKERFSIEQQDVFQFMKGKLSVEELAMKKCKKENLNFENKKIKNLLNLGSQIQNFLIEKQLQPMVRTSYLRAAFQLSNTNLVRISLDTNLCMVDEYMENNHPSEPWCRVAEDLLGKNEVVRFPYAVLEVKLQTTQAKWISKMLDECEAIAVFKFSKFQHGMAFLHRNLTVHSPHWLEEFERRGFVAGFTAPRSYDGGLSANATESMHSNFFTKLTNEESLCINKNDTVTEHRNFSRLVDKRILHEQENRDEKHRLNLRKEIEGKGEATLKWMKNKFECNEENSEIDNDDSSFDLYEKKVRSRAKRLNRCDPKSFFAAERTFLHYVQKALYLSAISSLAILLYPANQNVITFLLSPLCIAIIIYSYCLYIYRINVIQRRMTNVRDDEKERFDSKIGPVLIFISLLFFIIFSVLKNLLN